MNNVTINLENSIVSYTTSLYFINQEAADIVKMYFATTASSLVSALATNSTPATTTGGGGLSKLQFVNGITICQQLQNFFGNAAVTTGDYFGNCETMVNANTPATTALSTDVENLGGRIAALAANLIQLNKDGNNINKAYSASGLSGILGSIASTTIVFGCNVTQSRLIGGVVLVQQFLNFLQNLTVTTGDYYTTVSIWVNGS